AGRIIPRGTGGQRRSVYWTLRRISMLAIVGDRSWLYRRFKQLLLCLYTF
ncbi:hypothetical protein PanWU01x14_332320, partial [Parasponia andersonii]